MKTTDRRSFLRGSLTGLAGLAAMPLLGGLTGCQQVPIAARRRKGARRAGDARS